MHGVIDADTHVVEHEGMWDNFDDGGKMYSHRPILVKLPSDTSWGGRNAFFLIDGEMFPKSVGKNKYNSHAPSEADYELARTDISVGARQMTDIESRLNDMDRRGVEMQVVYSTLFLRLGVTNPDLEVALCHAYNKFMAEACDKSQGRIRFVSVLPYHTRDAAVAEMNWAKQQGTAGLHFRPVEAERNLGDRYFDPIYEEANRLNLPICIHTGGARFPADGPAFSGGSPSATLGSILSSKLPERFPNLRFGFIEFGSLWVPQAIRSSVRTSRARFQGADERSRFLSHADPELFKESRIYVACFSDDDIPWILEYIGEDNVIVGSDYSHQDPSEEMNLVEDMRARKDVDGAVMEKILCENARGFYNLDGS